MSGDTTMTERLNAAIEALERAKEIISEAIAKIESDEDGSTAEASEVNNHA